MLLMYKNKMGKKHHTVGTVQKNKKPQVVEIYAKLIALINAQT